MVGDWVCWFNACCVDFSQVLHCFSSGIAVVGLKLLKIVFFECFFSIESIKNWCLKAVIALTHWSGTCVIGLVYSFNFFDLTRINRWVCVEFGFCSIHCSSDGVSVNVLLELVWRRVYICQEVTLAQELCFRLVVSSYKWCHRYYLSKL